MFLGKTLHSHGASVPPVVGGYLCDRLASHPGEVENTPSHVTKFKTEINAGLVGLVARM